MFMFTFAFGVLFPWTSNKLEVLGDIPTNSIDYWIGNISPRCLINMIYHEHTRDLVFNSTGIIPVRLVTLQYYSKARSDKYHFDLFTHQYYDLSLRFLNVECYFSILYYKPLNTLDYTYDANTRQLHENDDYLNEVIQFIAHGFKNIFKWYSKLTYVLILYHGRDRNDEKIRFIGILRNELEMNLGVVYLSNSSKNGYDVYCRTPSLKFDLAARNVVNEVYSIVDEKFLIACSSQYTIVDLSEHDTTTLFDAARLTYEIEIVTSLLLKANVSLASKTQRSYGSKSIPVVVLSDFGEDRLTLSLFPTFDESIRFFTCYTFPALSFHFYVSAFDMKAWISIILSGILIATFLKCHIYYNLSKSLNFSTLLFYFSIFMEEAYSIPSIVQNSKVYRTATVLWLLTAVVLTNCYISHVISGLNAPLAGEKINNNDLYQNSSKEPEIKSTYYPNNLLFELQVQPSRYFDGHLNSFLEELHSLQTPNIGYTILSEPVRLPYPQDVWLHFRNPFLYTGYYKNLVQYKICGIGYFFAKQTSLCETITTLMRLSNKYYPAEHTHKRPWNSSEYPTGAVEEELVQCQKSVYMERSDQLEFKYISENYRKKRFYYLQKKLASEQHKWGFYNLQKSKLPFYFRMFLQSGIYHELHKLKLFGDHHKRRSMTSEIIERTRTEVLGMTSSVQTVFILFAAMALLAKLAFVVELVILRVTSKTFCIKKRIQ